MTENSSLKEVVLVFVKVSTAELLGDGTSIFELY